ncbi:MAG: DEAD/DEAH box helicase, partial [Candidatus Methanofastidiosa archaeon]|nr:DEAD/DEAH box helicase [Candidatus Methanofastidiosa archaeon]
HPSVLAFTRTKHRANRLADFLEKNGVSATRIHGARSQAQRTEALKGFKRGNFRVMVATDIAARGIDINSLALVVNFDVPAVPEDYIHRVGRTARVQEEGDAYTFVSPSEERELHFIEKHIGKRILRKKIEGFDYSQKPKEKLELPLEHRIAEIRARKAEDRERAKAKGQKRVGSKFFSKESSNYHGKDSKKGYLSRFNGRKDKPDNNDFFERKSNSNKEFIPEDENMKRPSRKENRRIPEGFSFLRDVYKKQTDSKGADGKPYFTRGKSGAWEEQTSSLSAEKIEKSASRSHKRGKGKLNFTAHSFNKRKKKQKDRIQ